MLVPSTFKEIVVAFVVEFCDAEIPVPAIIWPYFAYSLFDVIYSVLLSYPNVKDGCVVAEPADKIIGAVAV